jgi:uncharacterized protein YggU (UPF0235/DUF167 family)
MVLHLRAKPNARVDQLRVAADGTVSVHLKAPPHDGQANAVLLAYLAEVLGTSKSRVELPSGHTAPFKKVDLRAVDEELLATVLDRYRAAN